jgi:beta-aspartyl-dipeptidase (metallo-type)
MILIKNIKVFNPDNIGVNDVLVCGEKIEKISKEINIPNDLARVIDGTGKIMIPGLIDQHIHITGGGGEGGYTTRVPELKVTELVEAGLTTAVGLLGTDGTTRSVENLVSKAKAINELGLTCYALTGSYEYPTVTLTDGVKKDITFIDEIIGTKLAISDHRSSSPTVDEIARVASDTKVAGMFSGKAGTVTLHVGNGKAGLEPIFDVLDDTEIPIFVFRPTHLNRNEMLLKQSFEFAKIGGYIDYTCGIGERLSPSGAIRESIIAGVPQDKITFSSDGYGSWSNYDEEGNLTEIGVSSVKSTFKCLINMVENENFSFDEALPYVTTNVAKGLRLEKTKGKIAEGFDADMLVLDENNNIDTFISRGNVMMEDGKITVRFPFE